jgi:hypothetical protein
MPVAGFIPNRRTAYHPKKLRSDSACRKGTVYPADTLAQRGITTRARNLSPAAQPAAKLVGLLGDNQLIDGEFCLWVWMIPGSEGTL